MVAGVTLGLIREVLVLSWPSLHPVLRFSFSKRQNLDRVVAKFGAGLAVWTNAGNFVANIEDAISISMTMFLKALIGPMDPLRAY